VGQNPEVAQLRQQVMRWDVTEKSDCGAMWIKEVTGSSWQVPDDIRNQSSGGKRKRLRIAPPLLILLSALPTILKDISFFKHTARFAEICGLRHPSGGFTQ
jgi:hypothetical protein